MLGVHETMDLQTMQLITQWGVSRIPVYRGHRHNILGDDLHAPRSFSDPLRPSQTFALTFDGLPRPSQEAVSAVENFYSQGLDESMRCVPHVAGRRPAAEPCAYLVAKSAFAWRVNEGNYRDDITCIVLWLPDLVAELMKNAAKAMDK